MKLHHFGLNHRFAEVAGTLPIGPAFADFQGSLRALRTENGSNHGLILSGCAHSVTAGMIIGGDGGGKVTRIEPVSIVQVTQTQERSLRAVPFPSPSIWLVAALMRNSPTPTTRRPRGDHLGDRQHSVR